VAVKLIMTWDILPGREQDYFEFVVRDFIPSLQRMGMEPSDAWYTVYGKQPQIMTAAQMPTLTALQDTLNTNEWQSLTRTILDYVENFEYKIVPSRTGFQL
jgi:hypothetical protein